MPYFAGWYTRTRTALFFHMLCRDIWFYELPAALAMVGWLAEPIYLRMLRPRQPVVTISQSTKRDLLRHGFRESDITIISEGTHLEPVLAPQHVTKFARPTVLSLGSLRPMKRTLDQILAFELAKASMPDLQLKLAGDASSAYGERVLASVAASVYSSDIEVFGRITDAQKRELMQRSHLITVTSVKEGWGLIVTEAAGQGTPAVVYGVDGLRDAVRHGQTGLITPTNTPAALAKSIVELVSDTRRYADYRQAAWEWSRQLTFDRAYADFAAALAIPRVHQVPTVTA
jgi:glycosyltransferase involved in cell wall biosynthesis